MQPNGLVLVNPSTSTDTDILLDRYYLDPISSQTVTRITMPPESGKILLHAPPGSDVGPVGTVDCLLWLDAANVVTQSAQEVTQWLDINHGYIAVPVEGQPNWGSNSVAGLPGVHFNGLGALSTGTISTNVGDLKLSLGGVATAAILDASVRFLDFAGDVGHIGPGGVAIVNSDIYVEVTAVVSGAFNTTFSTKTWAGMPLPFELSFNTSAMRSDVLTGGLSLAFPYVIGVAELGMTLTLDLIVDVVGTAHVVPDPAFGGLTALGLGAAGAWLRRRR